MRGRGFERVVMVAAVATGLAATLSARAPEPSNDRPFAVDVRLTASPDLSPATIAALRTEAETLWRPAGVWLRWTPSPAEDPADASLRVLVMDRAAPGVTPVHTWAVGELLKDQAGAPFAVVSTAAARRVVASAGQPHDPIALVDRRLALVLGRAVAHEVGHFLLDSAGHTSRD